ALERARLSWLREPIAGFLRDLEGQGFKRETLVAYANRLLRLGELAAQRGIEEVQRLPEMIEPVVASISGEEPHRERYRALLSRFLRHLVATNTISAPEPVTRSADPHAAIVEDYAAFLRDERGLSDLQ